MGVVRVLSARIFRGGPPLAIATDKTTTSIKLDGEPQRLAWKSSGNGSTVRMNNFSGVNGP